MDRRTGKDEKGSFHGVSSIAAVSISEEPGTGKPHAGAVLSLSKESVRGMLGNRQSCRDGGCRVLHWHRL
jgi:hypothetical protein